MADPYRVEVSGPARRQLAAFPAKIRPALAEFITGALADNPHRLGRQLRYEPYRGLWSARYGGLYRIRYDIDEGTRTVVVLDVDTRGRAYRPG